MAAHCRMPQPDSGACCGLAALGIWTFPLDIRAVPTHSPGAAGMGGNANVHPDMTAMRKALLTAFVFITSCCMLGPSAQSFAADDRSPFAALPGRWVGQGRLGLKDGKAEMVRCRATYFLSKSTDELKQNIRCASASGKIEVKSVVVHKAGKLSGTWREHIYELGGPLAGEVTKRGFRISVRGSDLTANMEVIVKGDRQLIEIQFFDSALIGLTLILKKG